MIGTDLKISLRRLFRSRGYVVINVLGLATGLACCTFIALYVADELSYERFHDNADRIVRIVEDQAHEGSEVRTATTFGPLAPALESDLAGVTDAVRAYRHGLLLAVDEETRMQEPDILFVDSTFLEVFSFDVVSGDPATALDAPFSMALTRRSAMRLFGTTDAVGRTIDARDGEDQQDFTVTAIVEDPPANTHLQFGFLCSFSSTSWLYGHWIDDPQNWSHPPLYTYALLGPGVSVESIDRQVGERTDAWMGEVRAETRTLRAEPLRGIRLHSGRVSELTPSSSAAYVRLLAIVAAIVLLLACLNFGNMAAAHGATRLSEFGTRKAMGAARPTLMRLLLTESTMVAAAAVCVALAATVLLMPVMSGLAGKTFEPTRLFSPAAIGALIAVALVIAAAAVAWPAAVLARAPITSALRGQATGELRVGFRFSRALVVVQFVACVALVLGTLTVQSQVNFMVEDRLGFEKEHVVVMPLRDLGNQTNHDAFLESIRRLPSVESATASSGMPGLDGGVYRWKVRTDGERDSIEAMVLTVESDYAETYGLEFVAGRDFAREFESDADGSYLINQAAAAAMGWTPDDAIGRRVSLSFWFDADLEKEAEIVGVVRNFQYHSLHRGFDPMLFHILPGSYYYDYVSARIVPTDPSGTIAAMTEAWNAFNPGRPFEYHFLDDQFDALYRSETRLAGLFGGFAILAIVVACLGLFGLAATTTAGRTKEIGVRKVLGATAASVFGLLSAELLKPVMLAILIAVPLTYAMAYQWLSGYAEHILPSVASIIAAAFIALGVSWIAVAYSAIRAASADPVKSLRYE